VQLAGLGTEYTHQNADLYAFTITDTFTRLRSTGMHPVGPTILCALNGIVSPTDVPKFQGRPGAVPVFVGSRSCAPHMRARLPMSYCHTKHTKLLTKFDSMIDHVGHDRNVHTVRLDSVQLTASARHRHWSPSGSPCGRPSAPGGCQGFIFIINVGTSK